MAVALCFLTGCSLQQQRDEAERQWLQTKAIESTVHRVRLQQSSSEKGKSFGTARYASTQVSGHLNTPLITELSGLAPIQGSENAYWAINDSGNRPELFAVSEQGQLIGRIGLPVFNRDWEDIASFTRNGVSWIVVAETGDNLRRQATSSLYFFQQPDITDINNLPLTLALHHRIDFHYEDGPKNVESIAVSLLEEKIFLIAKEHGSARVYSLPLVLGRQAASLTAKLSGHMYPLFPTKEDKWWERRFAKKLLLPPTGLDISDDDSLAVVANYRHAYLFRREAGETWGEALLREPQILSTHRMEQSESIAFSPDGERVILSSEGLHAPVLVVSPSPVGS